MSVAVFSEPVFVLSLLLSDPEVPGCIVLGVRRATVQSSRHPGVLSTPTQRVPAALFVACQPVWPLPTVETQVVDIERSSVCLVGGGGTSAAPLGFAVESLLCRKLGLTAALAEGRVRGAAQPTAVATAVVEDPRGSGLAEATVMLTVRVQVEGLHEALPTATAFYEPLMFSPAATFVLAVERNDALSVDHTLDPFEVCIGGLCVTSGATILRREGVR